MKIAVHLNTSIASNLRADCLGGEWRWERQVLEALLQSDRFEKVYSLQPVWKSSEPMPAKFVDGLPADEAADTIGIMHDSYHVAEQYHLKGLVIQVHRSTHPCTKFAEEYGKKFFITYDRVVAEPDILENTTRVSAVSVEHVENIAIPSVPCVHETNNFDQNIILFPAKAPMLPRGVIDAIRNPDYWGQMFPWCADKLKEDSKKELHFLTGYQQADLDFIHCEDMRASFFSSPQTKCLEAVADRVVLHRAMSWAEVLDVYARTKVVVSTLSTGGSVPEAASYGVPVIGPATSPLAQFPEFLIAPCLSAEYLALTDRLYYDREFYTRIGNAYREYVSKYYTYAAYTERLAQIFAERGMS